jgi:hypothetical protein
MGSDTDKSRIANLQIELSAIHELPPEPSKSLTQRADELSSNIKELAKLRARAAKKGSTELDRIRFETRRHVVTKQLEKLKLDSESGVE